MLQLFTVKYPHSDMHKYTHTNYIKYSVCKATMLSDMTPLRISYQQADRQLAHENN